MLSLKTLITSIIFMGLANKGNNMDYVWGLMVLLALGLTMVFIIYIFPTETIL
jgi:hypothetical protein